MSRRVRLPGADELFRTTDSSIPDSPETARTSVPLSPGGTVPPSSGPPSGPQQSQAGTVSTIDGRTTRPSSPHGGVRQTVRPRPDRDDRRPSGRISHDEKITVYLSPEELIDLEHARLGLRQQHGMAVDRGRIVREAIAVVLEDLEARGDASTLVRRLRSV
jgi:hypothetical protein